MTEPSRKPAVIEVEDLPETEAPARRGPEVFVPPPEPKAITVVETLADRSRRTLPWTAILWSAVSGLVTMMLGIWLWSFVETLFVRFGWVGWIGMTLLGLAVLALLALALREIRAVFRLREISDLRDRIDDAGETISLRDARAVVRDVEHLYAGRPDMAAATAALAGHRSEVMDGADLLKLAERDLIGPLDARAVDVVSGAARRVSVVTAVSPRALIDVGFVLWENARLISRVAALYGGRPGRLSFFRLARRTLAHLAVTSGMALGDSIVQQALGQGLTAKLSARLGEGVLNGFLTARVGLAAIEVCRPMPFKAQSAPSVSKVMSGIVPSVPSSSDKAS